MTNYTALCAQGEAAMEGTTEGPWTLCAHLANDHENGCTCGYRGVIYAGDSDYAICQPGHDVTPGEEGLDPPRRPRLEEVANARFIAWARNNVPALIAAIRELEAQRDEVVNQLDSAQHSVDVLEKRVATFMSRAEAAEAKLAEVERERDEAQALAEALTETLTKREERLQITHMYRMDVGADDAVRYEVPQDQRDAVPDKITCLEAEIELLSEDLDRLKDSETHELNRAEAAEAKLAEVEKERDRWEDTAKHSEKRVAYWRTLAEKEQDKSATLTAQVEAMRGDMTPQKAARYIIDHVLHEASQEAVRMRLLMCRATMTQRHPSLPMHRRWAMVNEAIHTLAALTTEERHDVD